MLFPSFYRSKNSITSLHIFRILFSQIKNHDYATQQELLMQQQAYEISLSTALNQNEKFYHLENMKNQEDLMRIQNEMQRQTMLSKYFLFCTFRFCCVAFYC